MIRKKEIMKTYLLDIVFPILLMSYGICGVFEIYSKILYFFSLLMGAWILTSSTINLHKDI
jgi:hypothetical protein